jgi:hypothetical protein
MAGSPPRFRRDLRTSSVEADGVNYVEATDPFTSKSFRFYDFEHTVALALDGSPLEEVIERLRQSNQIELTLDQLAAFADQLHALGFLVIDAPTGEQNVSEGGIFPQRLPEEGETDVAPAITPPTPPAPAAPTSSAPPGALAVSAAKDGAAPPGPSPTAVRPGVPSAPVGAGPRVGSAPESGSKAGTPPPLPRGARTPAPVSTAHPGAPPPGTAAAATTKPSAIDARPPESSVSENRAPSQGAPVSSNDGGGPTRPVPSAGAPVAPAPATTNGVGGPLKDRGSGAGSSAASLPALAPDRPANQAARPENNEQSIQSTPRSAEGLSTEQIAGASNPQALPREQTTSEAQPESKIPVNSGSRRSFWPLYLGLGIVAVVIAGAVSLRMVNVDEPQPLAVRTLVPSPTSVFRWFAGTASIQPASTTVATFPSGGRVVEILPAGTRFGVGDLLALLESGRRVRNELARHRERLAYYEQMHETLTGAGNRAEIRQAELKVAEKKRFVAEAKAALASHAVIASQPGEIDQSLVSVGAQVKPGEAAVKLKGGALRATFELSREETERTRALGFCRVEVEGKPLDCSLATEGGDETHIVVELPNDPVASPGKTVRLARARYDAVFSIPPSALVRVGDTHRLYVAGSAGRAEMRLVAVVDQTDDEAVIAQGLEVGDQVIVDARDLRADALIQVVETVRQ